MDDDHPQDADELARRIRRTADVLKALDALDGRATGDTGYDEVAVAFHAALDAAPDSQMRAGSLFLQRLDFLADREADHPKYFEQIVRSILGIPEPT